MTFNAIWKSWPNSLCETLLPQPWTALVCQLLVTAVQVNDTCLAGVQVVHLCACLFHWSHAILPVCTSIGCHKLKLGVHGKVNSTCELDLAKCECPFNLHCTCSWVLLHSWWQWRSGWRPNKMLHKKQWILFTLALKGTLMPLQGRSFMLRCLINASLILTILDTERLLGLLGFGLASRGDALMGYSDQLWLGFVWSLLKVLLFGGSLQ